MAMEAMHPWRYRGAVEETLKDKVVLVEVSRDNGEYAYKRVEDAM